MEHIYKTGDKVITLAETAGFCFGVKRAVEMAEQAAEQASEAGMSGATTGGASEARARAYSLGPIIHNEQVTKRLADKGLQIISDIDDAPDGATVVIRSHGEPRKVYEKAAARNIHIIDATCPFVEKIHKLAAEADKQLLIVGDKNHPEVQGIAGWAPEGAEPIIAATAEEAAAEAKAFAEKLQTASAADETETQTETEIQGEAFAKAGEVFAVAQTTIKQETLDEVTGAFAREGVDVEVHNTICSATSSRQKECAKLAQASDLMIVIGDRHSSNTKKLFEIAKKSCEETFFVENIEDLPLQAVKKYNKIGTVAGASTPDYTIKEVIASMSDVALENKELTMDDLMEDIDKSLRLPRSGEIVTGKVHQVNEKEVIVNLGCKKDGILPINEVSLEEGQILADLFKVDDEVQAKVIKTDDGDGGILLSRKKLEISANWGEIVQALEDKSVLEVKVTRTVNGGVIAEYKEVSGFIPLSQLSDHYVENAEEFVGQTMEVKVSKVDQRRNRAVFSHKMFLNEEKNKLIAEIWDKLNVDDVVEGTVMRFTDYGAFVDIGGVDGLLHISEISWGKLKHPQEVLSIGQKINVKVLSMNAEKGKISLGLKQTTPEPWSVIDEKYEVGQVIEGKVVQIKEYGAFVELEPGLDGLVHISEVAHKRVGNINDELEVGQKVTAKILEIDKDRKRISLSIRETIDPPAKDEAPAKAPVEEEAPAEEAPVEEAPVEAVEEAVEEAPAVEEPAEEPAPAEEAPAEEAE